MQYSGKNLKNPNEALSKPWRKTLNNPQKVGPQKPYIKNMYIKSYK